MVFGERLGWVLLLCGLCYGDTSRPGWARMAPHWGAPASPHVTPLVLVAWDVHFLSYACHVHGRLQRVTWCQGGWCYYEVPFF
jgi:hypothetical protein